MTGHGRSQMVMTGHIWSWPTMTIHKKVENGHDRSWPAEKHKLMQILLFFDLLAKNSIFQRV